MGYPLRIGHRNVGIFDYRIPRKTEKPKRRSDTCYLKIIINVAKQENNAIPITKKKMLNTKTFAKFPIIFLGLYLYSNTCRTEHTIVSERDVWWKTKNIFLSYIPYNKSYIITFDKRPFSLFLLRHENGKGHRGGSFKRSLWARTFVEQFREESRSVGISRATAKLWFEVENLEKRALDFRGFHGALYIIPIHVDTPIFN